MRDRVTADELTGIDEIVLAGVDVHIEALSRRMFTLIFTRADGFRLQADLWAKGPLTMLLLDGEGVDGVEMEDGVWKGDT